MSVLWSSASVEWSTPADLFTRLDRRHHFTLDAAATTANAKVANWLGPDHPDPSRRDALVRAWDVDSGGGAVWVNPPYGPTIGARLVKAATARPLNTVEAGESVTRFARSRWTPRSPVSRGSTAVRATSVGRGACEGGCASTATA